jgi:hypothetical protein
VALDHQAIYRTDLMRVQDQLITHAHIVQPDLHDVTIRPAVCDEWHAAGERLQN